MKQSLLLFSCVLALLACTPSAMPVTPALPPTPQQPQEPQPQTPDTPDTPDQPSELATKVFAADASSVTSTTASIRCNYTDAPSVGVYDRGVYYGTSASALTQQAALNSSSATSGYFTVKLSSLEPGITYYYKAYVTVWDDAVQQYVDVFSDVKNFTTQAGGASAGLQYLGGYEIPAVDLKNKNQSTNSGTETYGSTRWYQYDTNNSDQKVITHTYSYNGKQYRNYTCLVDRTKMAPLWSAFVMQNDAYPRNSVGRVGSWTPDPGIPSS
ncbi:MAG: fibronectin type III domain-containing protein, partial [Bacteroidales bacterium]|nr:fibronectin type III domain-containing protein [Bacteroidales bacterium]